MKLKYLTYKYPFLFPLFIMILSGYLFFAFYGEAKKNAIEALNANQMLHAKQAAKEIETFFERWIESLVVISKDQSIITINELGKKEMKFFLDTHSNEIIGITRVDATGKIAYTVPYIRDAIGKDISYQQHIKEIMQTHKPVVSDVFKAVQGFEAVAVHVPVFRGKTYDGTIGILINFQIIAKRSLEDIKIGETGYAWMTSRDGTELYCPVPGHIGKSVFENCKDFPTIIAMAREMLEGKHGVTTYKFDKIKDKSIQTVKKHAVYMPIKLANTFWSIVVATSEDEIMKHLENFRNKLLAVMCFLLLGGILFSYQGMKAWGIIQEEKRRTIAENKLRESERRLSDIINFLPDAILAIDKEGKVIAWNKAIEEMTGYSAESMLGKGDHEYAIPFYGKRRPILIDFVSKWDQEIEKQYSFIKKDGNILFTETSMPCVRGQNRILRGKASPLYDSQGNVVGAIESIQDITESRLAEDELFSEKEKLLTILENAPFAMVLINRDGRFIYMNPMFMNIFGYSSSEIPDGKTWFKKAYPDATYRKEVITAWINDIKVAIPGKQRPRVFNVTCKDGSVKIINFIPVLLSNSDNIMVCEDITERKRMEEQLANAQKMEAIGTLAGGIAHDFNNILAAILGNISLAKIYLKNNIEKAAIKIDEAEKAVFRARGLTQQLLTFSRGGVPVRKTVLLAPLLNKSTLFALRGSSVQANFNIHENLFPVDIDEGMIGQAINNLIINAMQAMPEGGSIDVDADNIILENSTTIDGLQMEKGRYIKIMITDHGIGISRKHIDKIFDPYFTTKEDGIGLGLTTAFSIIKRHGGHITVNSELGEGTTFTVYLMASPEHIDVNENTEKPLYGKGKILLMDDDEAVLNIAGEMLAALGYEVEHARNGVETIGKYKKMLEQGNPFDLVIMDLTIPGGMGGKDAIKGLLALDKHVKAIVSSGYSNDPIMGNYKEYGFVGVAAKPYKLKELSEIVQKAIQQ